MSKWH